MFVVFILLLVISVLILSFFSGRIIGNSLKEKMKIYQGSRDNPYGSLIQDFRDQPDLILAMEYNFENYSYYPGIKERVQEAIKFTMEKCNVTYSVAKSYIFYEFNLINNSLLEAMSLLNR